MAEHSTERNESHVGEPEYVLAETQIEERDGASWVTGLCPACWERFAFQTPPRRGPAAHVQCPNGHLLRIVEQTSAGGHPRV